MWVCARFRAPLRQYISRNRAKEGKTENFCKSWRVVPEVGRQIHPIMLLHVFKSIFYNILLATSIARTAAGGRHVTPVHAWHRGKECVFRHLFCEARLVDVSIMNIGREFLPMLVSKRNTILHLLPDRDVSKRNSSVGCLLVKRVSERNKSCFLYLYRPRCPVVRAESGLPGVPGVPRLEEPHASGHRPALAYYHEL